ncbi:MAG TPA: alkaline phosphatase family protein [Candidatus Cybelea sp.]|nr:alkaline phosphatase family protein [Candidatus Cybelea sp.]
MKRSWMLGVLVAPFIAGCLGSSTALPGAAQPPAPTAIVRNAKKPHASSVVIVIMENRDYDLVIGTSAAPYINKQLVPHAALMTNSHAITHPSEPNYLALFSGSTQGVDDDSCPHTFTTSNVGEELIAAGYTFDGYSESMPYDGYTGCSSGEYARKHNPWVNFTNVPASSNLVYQGFVTPSALTIVVPNLCHDMHDCSTQTGDTWLKSNLPAFLKYDKQYNGLLVLTWDEADPDANGQNQIATLLLGPMIKPGKYAQDITHYSTLRTIEDIFGVACTAAACQASDLKDMWR